jgi:hypothetical protein
MESETLGWHNFIQKRKSLNEEEASLKSEEETKSIDNSRSESVTPRASTASITVQ